MSGSQELERLRTEGKLADVLLMAWAATEMLLEGIVLMEYGLYDGDTDSPLCKPLTSMSYDAKLALMRDVGLVPADDYKILEQFRTDRNDLFHQDSLLLSRITDDMRDELMSHALLATRVTEVLFEKALQEKERKKRRA